MAMAVCQYFSKITHEDRHVGKDFSSGLNKTFTWMPEI